MAQSFSQFESSQLKTILRVASFQKKKKAGSVESFQNGHGIIAKCDGNQINASKISSYDKFNFIET